jgi:chaperonin GroES
MSEREGLMELKRKLDLNEIVSAPNVADLMELEDVSALGNEVLEGFRADLQSRGQWEEMYAAAMKLTLQVTEQKSEPWMGAANVKFPLVTIAAMHYAAKAYPLLIRGVDLVKCRVIGKVTPEKQSRADRIAAHMSYQLLEQDAGWEAEMDKLLMVQGIMGCAFKKSYFDAFCGHNKSVLVNPQDLVVNYWLKGDLNEGPRATHRFNYSKNQVHERVKRGFYSDFDLVGSTVVTSTSPLTEARDKREGLTRPADDDTTPVTILEQLCWYDLDGDGYAEPYVATVEEVSGKLRRLVARFNKSDITRNDDNDVVRIEPVCIYTKYGLIPAPDGGFYDLGFGRLLGPINDSVNTMLNQVIDAGTMSHYGGGFLGRGTRFRGGQYTFKPQEWKQVDSPGDDLRKNIVPLPVREPSRVLVELLMYLVGYGERIASANDVQVGENVGQNTPAATAQMMNENGARVFSAIYKRDWRSFRDELRVLYRLNQVYLQADAEFENLTNGAEAIVHVDDYMGPPTDVRPAADPTMVNSAKAVEDTAMVMGLAFKLPGFNRYLSVRRHLEARGIQDIDEVFPVPEGGDLQAPPDPKMLQIQIDQQRLELEKQELAADLQTTQIELQQAIAEGQARIMKLHSEAMKLQAEAKGVEQGHMIGFLQAQMQQEEQFTERLKIQAQQLKGRIDLMLGQMKIKQEQVATQAKLIDAQTKQVKLVGETSKVQDQKRDREEKRAERKAKLRES